MTRVFLQHFHSQSASVVHLIDPLVNMLSAGQAFSGPPGCTHNNENPGQTAGRTMAKRLANTLFQTRCTNFSKPNCDLPLATLKAPHFRTSSLLSEQHLAWHSELMGNLCLSSG
jgi:hypothetical protein